MKLLDSLRFRIATLFHRSQMNAEIEEELRSHIQHGADDLEDSGLNRAEAERRARIEFGGHARFKEESREALGGNFIETLIQDVRLSLRKLRKSPGFTAVAVVTLALAIGANAVVFSVMNAFLLHPLNVPQEESLYAVWRTNVTSSESYPDYLELRDRNRSFDGLAAYSVALAALDTGENPSRAWVDEVSGNYFDALGITDAQAIADLNSIGSDLERNYPNDDGNMKFSLARPGLYGDYLGRPVRAFLTGLMLLAGLILLAACANLGSLFAARVADRSRELALRLALGSSRGRILRQLFTEAVLISLIGGAVGLWGSIMLLSGLSAWQPFPRFPIHVAVTPDANVYGVALLLTLAGCGKIRFC